VRERDLEALLRFREWESKCMRQDLKIALNSALWCSMEVNLTANFALTLLAVLVQKCKC
jgi:hypothetical protein